MTWTLPAPGPGASPALAHHLAQAYRIIQQGLDGSVQAGQDYYVGGARIWITAPDGTKHYISVDNAGNIGADGVSAQPLDATLTALAATSWALNSMAIGTGSDTVAQVAFAANTFPARASTGDLVAKPISDFALTFLDDANAAAVRTTLGLGTMALVNSPVPIADGGTAATTAAGARTNLAVLPIATPVATTSLEVQGANTTSIKTYSDAASQVVLEAYNTSTPATKYQLALNKYGGFVTVGGDFFPLADNARVCGAATNRWSVVYAATGTINTSDARDKEPLQPLSAAELAAARQLASEIGMYQWTASVQAKGADARLHAGLTVQRAIEIMQAHGLDPFRYAFICYDAWEDGDRFSFRHDQLSLFMARAVEERLAAIEAFLNL